MDTDVAYSVEYYECVVVRKSLITVIAAEFQDHKKWQLTEQALNQEENAPSKLARKP